MSRPRLIALVLAFATLVVYLPATRFDFINYDDTDYVTKNPFVLAGPTWTDIQWAFTTGHASNWHPLTWISLMADHAFFGLNAGGYHLVNVLLHAANAALVFALLLRLTGALWPAAFIAALFAWHPLHVESVAWIAERKDVLSTFFALLSLLAYARYGRENCRRHFWLALLFFTLGLLSKPMVVTLPFVMLLLDYWPLARVAGSQTPTRQPSAFGRLIFEKWPFFLLTIISCVVTILVQHRAVSSLETVPLIYRFENVPTAYVAYLAKLFWPVNLAVIYPIPQHFYPLKVAMVVTTLIGISAAAWLARKRAPYLLIGWLWFLGTLVPVIGLVQVGGQAMADRYSYIPSIGVFMMIVFGSSDLAARFHFPKTALVAVATCVLTACVVLTEKQLSFWAGSETLFRHALAVTKDNDIAHINLGTILELDGKLNEAIAECLAAQQIAPDRFQIHNNLGDCYDRLGQPEKALPEYREAIRLNPNLAYIHLNLGTVLAELGRYDDALVEFTNDMQLDPASPWSHFEMAKAMLKLGRDSAAVDELHQARQLTPEDVQILTFTAHVLAAIDNPQVRDGKTALTLAARASTLTGGEQVLVLAAVGMADAETGDFTNAVTITKKALDLTTAADGEQLPDDQKRLQQQTKRRLEEQLQLYQNHQPWRESFRDTNAPVKP